VRIEQLRKNYDITVRWKAFPLHPDTPEEGLALEELYAGRGVDIHQVLARLKQVADELGLPLEERRRTYNSRRAQEMAKWAESKGKGDRFDEAVFRSYFVDGINIGKVEELAAIANGIGLSEEEALGVLESRTFRDAVDTDWERSCALGITGVPTFVIDRRGIVGFQPYEALERFLIDCGVRKGQTGRYRDG
jgi:predicted DsbA family dithiol-disulfide isomerase